MIHIVLTVHVAVAICLRPFISFRSRKISWFNIASCDIVGMRVSSVYDACLLLSYMCKGG